MGTSFIWANAEFVAHRARIANIVVQKKSFMVVEKKRERSSIVTKRGHLGNWSCFSLDSFEKNCYPRVNTIQHIAKTLMLSSTSSINPYTNIVGTPSGQSVEQLAKTLTRTMPTDSVTISSSAAMLQQFLNSEMGGGEATADLGELDLVGLAQLKQRGEMLASMLQLKLKNFESNLMATMKGAGMPMQDMDLKNGDDGLMLLGEMPDKEMIQKTLGGLQGEFTDMARLAEVLNMLQQLGPETKEFSKLAGLSSAAQYAQQSLPDRSSVKRPENDFVLHMSSSGTSFAFE